ncbi:kinase-like domain-containing protein [Cyathus striatus]|nr:kinase-like domain-containing protein [Cyathus striatus]
MSIQSARDAVYDFMQISQFMDKWRIGRSEIQLTPNYPTGQTTQADVYTAMYTNQHDTCNKVVIKFLRGLPEERLKLERRLVRELTVWSYLPPHQNIASFCGLVEPINGFNSVTCGVVAPFIDYKILKYAYDNPPQKGRLKALVFGRFARFQKDNILVNSNGTAKIIDFGLGRLNGFSGFTTATTGLMLNPRYTAHELISDESTVGPRPTFHSDIFSLGMTILELRATPPYGYHPAW